MGHAPPLNQGIKALYQGAMAFIRADALPAQKVAGSQIWFPHAKS
jgi:hypothetical protein